MAYSQDLRERVLGFVEKDGSKEEAAERYGVRVSTVYLWCKTPKKVRAEKPGPTGSTKLDLAHLEPLITERPAAYQAELATPLGVSRRTVGRGLAKLKWIRKKNDELPRERRHA